MSDTRHPRDPDTTALPSRMGWALFVFCTAVYLCTAPGRLLFPDDEIVFQTTASLWNDGDLAIDGIPKRTGEPKHRPSGTFGWAHGTDGRRYGFFGHGLSLLALPLYGLGEAMGTLAPEPWRHALRSDHYVYHRRSPRADWTRLTVSMSNSLITAASVCTLAAWLSVLGFSLPAAVGTALCYGLGTLAWPYSGTFLSEPLSAWLLLAAAWAVAWFHRLRIHSPESPRARRFLWLAGALTGASVHVHVLNLIAVPCIIGYALMPLWRQRALRRERKAWTGALAIGACILLLVGLDHMLRFGSPWETGRYGHYSHFVAPWEGLAAFLVAPGRSFLLYSPPVLIGLLGWNHLRARHPEAAWFIVALIATRVVFVAARSDWWGGWGIGPRYLVPVIPFALLPLASVLDRIRRFSRHHQALVWAGLGLSGLLQAHLATHSIWEWMFRLSKRGEVDGVGYFTRSHWYPSASPIVGFFQLPELDMLSMGAVRLAHHGHYGMVVFYAAILLAGMLAGLVLTLALARRRRYEHARRHGRYGE